MIANQNIFLNELAELFRSRLYKYYNSPKAIADFLNVLIYVPPDDPSYGDSLDLSGRLCAEINTSLEEEGMYVSLWNVTLDNSLQPIFRLWIEITDDDLNLELNFVLQLSQSNEEAGNLDSNFTEDHLSSDVWQKLITRVKNYKKLRSIHNVISPKESLSTF
jgi:hypothetical protein